MSIAAAYAVALRVPYWMAQSQRDYAGAILGVKHSTFSRWAKVGRLLCASPELHDAMRTGRVTMSQLEKLASEKLPATLEHQDGTAPDDQAGPAAGGPTPATGERTPALAPATGETTSEFTSLSLTAPAPAVLCIEECLELARGFVGTSDGDESAVSALLAEAGTECAQRVDPAVAKLRFRVKDRIPCPPDQPPDTQPPAQHARPQATTQWPLTNTFARPDLLKPLLPRLGEAAQRRDALRVHAILVRLIARRDGQQFQQEDQLFEWKTNGVHDRWGFHDFARFAEAVLDIPVRTCQEYLRRARLRRPDNAIAVARREGKISAVQSELLDHVYREAHVPASDLPRWCNYAATHTVRRLRKAIRWAKNQYKSDYRPWCLSHCAPPDEDQLRTTDPSLEGLVRDSGGETLTKALVSWEIAPRGTIRLVITRETRDELLVQMAAMQDELRDDSEDWAPRRVPAWYALCRVFHRARETWRVHYEPPVAARRRILDRDGYRCVAPECTQRRNLQEHHVWYRGRGGGNEDYNRATLCAFHHYHGEHGGTMRVRGRTDLHGRGLTWEMGLDENGRPRRVYQDERVLVAS